MFLFIFSQLLSAEPSKEVMIASVNQDSTGSVELGSGTLRSFEVSGSYGISEKLSVLVSYGYGGIQTSYEAPHRESAYQEDDYYGGHGYSFESGFGQHVLSVGARYRHVFNEWASAYGKAEGNVAAHTINFAPSISEDDPISKVDSMGISFGGTAALGVMGSFSIKENLPVFLIYFEGGYNFLSTASFDTIGDLDMSGGYSSVGCGLRF